VCTCTFILYVSRCAVKISFTRNAYAETFSKTVSGTSVAVGGGVTGSAFTTSVLAVEAAAYAASSSGV